MQSICKWEHKIKNFIIFFYSQGIFWDIWLDTKEEAVCYQSSNKKVNYHWTWLLVTNGVVGSLCRHFLFKSWVKCLLSGTLNLYIIAFMLTLYCLYQYAPWFFPQVGWTPCVGDRQMEPMDSCSLGLISICQRKD